MPRPSSDRPTELELQLLKILWDESPRTAAELRRALATQGRKLAHTSVITTLQKMVEKRQLVQLDPLVGKAFRFSPAVTRAGVSREMVGDLVNRVFDGSAEDLMLSLFDASNLDSEAVKRLRRVFNQKLREQQQ